MQCLYVAGAMTESSTCLGEVPADRWSKMQYLCVVCPLKAG